MGSRLIYAKDVRGVTDDTILIGLICDKTGPTAPHWKIISNAMENYIKHINSIDGINGRKIKFIIEDDRYSIPMAISAFKKLVFRDEILAFIGPGSTAGTFALMNQVQKLKVPNIAPALSERLITPPKKYLFITSATYTDQINILFDYIKRDLKGREPKLSFVYPDNEFGKSGLHVARRAVKRLASKLLTEEVHGVGDLDATSQILSLKRVKAEYVVLQKLTPAIVGILRTAKRFNYDAKFLATCYGATEDTVGMSGDAAENFIGVSPYASWYEDTPGMAKLREITLKLHPGTEEPMRSKFYTAGWIPPLILCEGLKRAGKDLNNESLIKALESIRGFDMKGICGPITYGPNDRKGSEFSRLYKADVKNSLLTPISGWIRPEN